MYSSLRAFAYHEPGSLEQACQILAQSGTDARVLAGGCDLVPGIRRRAFVPSVLVSVARVKGLDAIRFDGRQLSIFPMASLRSAELSEDLRTHFLALYEGVRSIASVQVKTTGTLLGNVCVATPASDISPPLMVLGAVVHVLGPEGPRAFPIAELFADTKRTSLRLGEIVSEISLHVPPIGTGSAFAKLTRTAADCAKLNVAARVTLEGDVATDVRIALGSVASTPIRAPWAEELLTGVVLDDGRISEAADAILREVRPITDLRSTADYRRQVLHVLVRRVIASARDRARGEAA